MMPRAYSELCRQTQARRTEQSCEDDGSKSGWNEGWKTLSKWAV